MRLTLRQIALILTALALLLDVGLMLKSYIEWGYISTDAKRLGLGLLLVLIVNLYLVRKARSVSK